MIYIISTLEVWFISTQHHVNCRFGRPYLHLRFPSSLEYSLPILAFQDFESLSNLATYLYNYASTYKGIQHTLIQEEKTHRLNYITMLKLHDWSGGVSPSVVPWLPVNVRPYGASLLSEQYCTYYL